MKNSKITINKNKEKKMIPKGLIAKANEIVSENFRNGDYHILSDKDYNYFVCLDGCGSMSPKKRMAYIYKQKDECDEEIRLTWDCQQSKKTFCRKDFEQ